MYGSQVRKRDDEGDSSTVKRMRGVPSGPSKVVHVKGVPSDTQENELVQLTGNFGTVVRCLVLGPKHQAFIEIDSLESAGKLLSHYASAQAFIRTTPVYLQYSSRTEITPNARYANGGDGSALAGEGVPNVVLMVSVQNLRLPVTLDNLHQVFRTFGDVLRIVTFEKGTFKALVEYSGLASAMAAKQQLEGKDMFQGCCTLNITYSSTQPPLRIVANNERARDFSQSVAPAAAAAPVAGAPAAAPGQYYQQQYDPYGGQYPPQGPSYPQAGGGYDPYSGAAAPGRQGPPPGGSVVLVNGLIADQVTCDHLFTLFGVYGDVHRVKIMWNKKETALVQFSNPGGAQTAIKNLDKCELFGSELSVIPSKNPQISLPPVNSKYDDSTHLTKSYEESKLHRFKKAGSRNEKHICAPAESLHLSNLPEGTTEEELMDLFASTPIQIRFFGNDNKMAFVTFNTVSEGVHALLSYHNHDLRGRNIRIAFSHAANRQNQPQATVSY